jgi:hypothetical protein
VTCGAVWEERLDVVAVVGICSIEITLGDEIKV